MASGNGSGNRPIEIHESLDDQTCPSGRQNSGLPHPLNGRARATNIQHALRPRHSYVAGIHWLAKVLSPASVVVAPTKQGKSGYVFKALKARIHRLRPLAVRVANFSSLIAEPEHPRYAAPCLQSR